MRTILIVRKFDEFSEILAANDYEIVNFPVIETSALDDLSDFEAILQNIESFDAIFLTSVAASEIFLNKLRALKLSFHGKIYVLGKRSYDLLRNEKLNLFFDETVNTTDEMLENISPSELKDKRFLFVRGDKSLRFVPDFLANYGTVVETIVYQTKKIEPEIDKINAIGEKLKKNEIVCACFFSPSGAEGFLEHFNRQILHQMNIAVIGKTTANFFEKQHLKVDFVSSKATAEDFATELIERLQNGKRETENEK